ncbi:MAG: type III pantothenate kinase [Planctomycetota bacterium]
MDINLLVVDAGHSRLKLGVFEAGELIYTRRLGIDGADRQNWVGVIEDAWKRLGDNGGEVAGSASNIGIIDDVAKAIREATGKSTEWVGRDLDLPIDVKTDVPGKTGVDRVLNIAAAYEQLKKACCVVDVGTAVTVDFASDDGKFLGGVIAPGPRLMSASLHEVAPQLPVVEPGPIDGPFGTDTESALRGGIVGCVRGLVRQACESYAMTLDAWPEIIATGGDAHAVFEGDEVIHAVSPDLTLIGIALAYANHHIEHRT